MIFQIYCRETQKLSEKTKGINKLKAICLELAIKNNLEIVDNEPWDECFLKGEKSPDGHYFAGWAENVSPSKAIKICREILSSFNAELHETLSINEWEERYKPITNELVSESDDAYQLFETYGEELNFVLKRKEENFRTIWTLVDGENGKLYISPGYHFCNRINYFITEVPWEDANLIEVQYCDEDFDADESADENYQTQKAFKTLFLEDFNADGSEIRVDWAHRSYLQIL